MKVWKSVSLTALAIGAFGVTGAMAEITAEQAWENILNLGGGYGEISGSPSRSGDTLTISGVTFSMETPEASVTGDIGDVTLTELGDGTVELRMPPVYPLSFSVDPAEGEAAEMVMTVRQTGMKTILSGTPENTAYDILADEASLSITEIIVDDEPIEANILLALEGLAGKYLVTEGDLRGVTASMNAGKGTFDMKIADPEGEGRADIGIEVADITSSSKSSLPADTDMTDMAAMMKSGFATDGRVTYGPVSMDFDFADGAETLQARGSAASGAINFAMNGESMTYGSTQNGLDLAVSGSEIPFPELTAQIAESAFRMQMPMAMTETARDFGLLASYRGVAISDVIWSMFDPAAMLPRDPANIVLDVSGKARWLVDMMDPEMMERMDAPPAELEALNINALELTAAGASLTGEGAFTFDNSDLATFGGMPRPTGSANLKLVGGNGLMDTLIQMGLLPEDQAMGFRMMLGLFARPGDGEDTLVSEIAVTEDGQVLANGQRLR